MSRPTNLGTAISAIVLASMLAGCAAPAGRRFASGANAGTAKLGPATRALMALNANDSASAVKFAEEAAQANPDDPTVRTLLGTAYFAAGRFASAETAYSDAIALNASDPKVVLKLVLVQIAQGKNGRALGLLSAARTALDSADYGLALALAGQPEQAVAVLEPAARAVSADPRIRQNLALSYALAGNWAAARTIAAQDVPADQLDGRIQQWLKLANPTRPSDQVAALTGVTPVADPGQPERLALRREGSAAMAMAAPAPVAASPAPVLSAPAPAPAVQTATAEPAYVPPSREPEQPAFKLEPVDVAAEPFVEVAPQPRSKPAVAPRKAPPSVRAAAFVPKPRAVPASAQRRQGKSNAVVQIGAYGSPQRVAQAWNAAARKYGMLRNYSPMSARFQSAQGTVYRLAVKGFGSPDEAKNLCVSLRRAGGNCFVRTVAGDAPVQIALR